MLPFILVNKYFHY